MLIRAGRYPSMLVKRVGIAVVGGPLILQLEPPVGFRQGLERDGLNEIRVRRSKVDRLCGRALYTADDRVSREVVLSDGHVVELIVAFAVARCALAIVDVHIRAS